ncbi:MAG TPA: proline dehydrogenase family protein [Bryobacteraceae bacterium]|jgi:proline dehydrogenase|nr:proline dehydrogenase family protein [Bryobacteraceae bacterium]
MLRRSLLYLSESRVLRQWMEQSRISQKFTSRFVAGRTLDDGLRVLRKLSAEGLLATLDFLGENVTSLREAEISRDTYLNALRQVQPFAATVSLKLTQFGLNLSDDACLSSLRDLMLCARLVQSRVEIDMESSEYVDRTLRIVEQLHAEFDGRVRAVIQAYLYRSEDDIARLSSQRIPVRLCKGAYHEPPLVAYPNKVEVDENYVKLMRQLLQKGAYPAIASHDESIIRGALAYVREQKIGPDRLEFQMLYGIRRDLQRELVAKGYRVRLYVPYGDAWFPYFMRRLAERPANLIFLAKNLTR